MREERENGAPQRLARMRAAMPLPLLNRSDIHQSLRPTGEAGE